MRDDLTYSDAIEKVMLDNGYFAPLKLIYRKIWDYKDKDKIKGKTPEFTIQERVQRDERFVKIGLGVYALREFFNQLPQIQEPKTEKDVIVRKHAEIQGMLLEIGNTKKEISDTYTNDKNWTFGNKKLLNIATLHTVPPFTYERIIKESVIYADVIWFNNRGFPEAIFEVEHSTDFRDAFIKFMELQDFTTKFYCVSDDTRFEKFKREKSKTAFKPIENRLIYLTYNQVKNDYENSLMKNFL